jgi:hypothetical protein
MCSHHCISEAIIPNNYRKVKYHDIPKTLIYQRIFDYTKDHILGFVAIFSGRYRIINGKPVGLLADITLQGGTMRRMWRSNGGKIARPHARSNFRRPQRSERRVPPAMEFDEMRFGSGHMTTTTHPHPHEDGGQRK